MLPRFCSPAGRAHRRAPIPCVENISSTIRKALGLHVHPHLFRHLAARLFLSRHPGHYEEVRRVLHHRNIQTTIDSYAGLEAATALNRYDDIVLSLKEGAA